MSNGTGTLPLPPLPGDQLRLPPIPSLGGSNPPGCSIFCLPFQDLFGFGKCTVCNPPALGGTGTGTTGAGAPQIPLLNFGSLGSVSVNRDTVISAIVVMVGLILIVIGAASYVGKHRVI